MKKSIYQDGSSGIYSHEYNIILLTVTYLERVFSLHCLRGDKYSFTLIHCIEFFYTFIIHELTSMSKRRGNNFMPIDIEKCDVS